MKKHLIKSLHGFPSLVIGFDGDKIEKIEFLKGGKSPKFSFKLTEKERKLVNNLKKDFYKYFSCKKVEFKSYLISNNGGTAFQKQVWNALKSIPYGTICSYKSVAQRIGKPKAARAVGGACRSNPVPILVPCHRVISKNGRIGGFSARIAIKKRLLRFEGVKFQD